MTVKPLIQPTFESEVQTSVDGKDVLRVFDYAGPSTTHEVMRAVVDCPLFWGDKWLHRRDEGTIYMEREISHCGHEHDCCGCLCHHSARISLHYDKLIMIEKTRRNY